MEKKLEQLKCLVDELQVLLENRKASVDAQYLLKELAPIFERVRVMSEFSPMERPRYIRFLMESSLSEDFELLDAYARFSNLASGLDIDYSYFDKFKG
jgi:hypothetical protein